MAFILLVEDEKLLRWGFRRRLELHGHIVHEASTLEAAQIHLLEHRPDIILLDVRLPDGSGLDFLSDQRAALTESLVIVVTASGQVETAVRAMKLGAFDFLSKPVSEDEMLAAVQQASERLQERNAVERSRRDGERAVERPIVAESREMKEVLALAASVAASPAATVLVTGETGTGKEVVARYVHAISARATEPLIAVNCAALPESLVESELFGHEKGAFTDARSSRKGAFELAHGGTVILDEVAEVPLAMQVKLLRFLEERTLRRVGGSREMLVDVRVVALTNRDLEECARSGTFRSDLFYRLNVFPVVIPPLRDRRDDIIPLANHFVSRFGALCRKAFRGIGPELSDALLKYDWPGNVRELRNLMERATILEPGGTVTGQSLPMLLGPRPKGAEKPAEEPFAFGDAELTLDEAEFLLVERAMKRTRGNQSQAGRLLGVTRDQVRYRIKRYRDEGRWRLGDVEEEAAES